MAAWKLENMADLIAHDEAMQCIKTDINISVHRYNGNFLVPATKKQHFYII